MINACNEGMKDDFRVTRTIEVWYVGNISHQSCGSNSKGAPHSYRRVQVVISMYASQRWVPIMHCCNKQTHTRSWSSSIQSPVWLPYIVHSAPCREPRCLRCLVYQNDAVHQRVNTNVTRTIRNPLVLLWWFTLGRIWPRYTNVIGN